MAKLPTIISDWHQLFENLQVSSLDFYASIEKAIEARAIPELNSARVEHKEGGLASAVRQYLRVHRGKHAFDICAAPFGTGFFVSWWLNEPPLRFGFLYTLAAFLCVFLMLNFAYGIGLAVGVGLSGVALGVFSGACAAFLGVPLVLWLIGNAIRQGIIVGESTVLAIPLIGWIYERIFAPPTFYSLDTAIMFRDAVHSAVLEVIDGMTTSKGIRALTEAERKPVMKRFATSA